MATNKNALIRYKHLDMLLSDRHHYYDINDLTERVNDILYAEGFKTVTRRCIEKDLVYLTEAPFRAPMAKTLLYCILTATVPMMFTSGFWR